MLRNLMERRHKHYKLVRKYEDKMEKYLKDNVNNPKFIASQGSLLFDCSNFASIESFFVPCEVHGYAHYHTPTHQHINTSIHQHINTSIQHINTSTHQYINTSTHQHINASTYKHINTSTYQHININTSPYHQRSTHNTSFIYLFI